MYERAKVAPQRIPGLLERYRGELMFKTDSGQPCFIYEKKRVNKKEKIESPIGIVKNVLIDLKGLIDA